MIDQNQSENVHYLNYLFSMTTNDTRCAREIKCWIAVVKTAFYKNKALSASKLE
jgi:hypothetical protein